jgi:hypothetical protein
VKIMRIAKIFPQENEAVCVNGSNGARWMCPKDARSSAQRHQSLSRADDRNKEESMYRKRLAALIMTGCLLTSVGCSTPSSGSGPLGFGLFSGCCGHSSSGGSSRMFASSAAPAVAATPVGGADCPCSHHGGGQGVFHPAVLPHAMSGPPSAGGPVMMGDAGMAAPMIAPQQFQGQPIPVTTQGVPPTMMNPPMFPANPGPTTLPPQGQPPRIQPVPQSPPMGYGPSAVAPATQWTPR